MRKIIKTTFHEYITEQIENESNINDKFWKWFGNSKAVLNNGKPLELYHGTKSEIDFEEFDGYTFFTDDFFNADGYASGNSVYEVYIRIENPMVIDCGGKKWDDLETPFGTSTGEVIGKVDNKKYDGVIFLNIKDSWIDDEGYQDPATIYVTFNANQIKATNNDGSWDLNDNNIYS